MRLSEVENVQNEVITKSGVQTCFERILIDIHEGRKGKKPKYYHKGEEVIIDITKDDIEKIAYCDRCMIYVVDKIAKDKCNKCGNEISWMQGWKLKNKKYHLYSDRDWSNFSENFTSTRSNEMIRYEERFNEKKNNGIGN